MQTRERKIVSQEFKFSNENKNKDKNNFPFFQSANLNKTYFVNRQDRYVKIEKSPDLCDFFVKIIETIGRHSFVVGKENEKFLGQNHPFEGDTEKYKAEVETSVRSVLSKFEKTFPRPKRLSNDEVLVVPLLQMGMFNINNDRDFNIHLYSNLPSKSEIFLATSYFNMTEEYAAELIDRKRTDTKLKLLTASPKANGFYGSRGISRYVPDGYTENERDFLSRAERKFNDDGQIQMFEFQRDQWTYHAKGLWLYDQENLPILTCVGSPNFGN